jgi:hypothetical protein
MVRSASMRRASFFQQAAAGQDHDGLFYALFQKNAGA